jgi:hypothetical protein
MVMKSQIPYTKSQTINFFNFFATKALSVFCSLKAGAGAQMPGSTSAIIGLLSKSHGSEPHHLLAKHKILPRSRNLELEEIRCYSKVISCDSSKLFLPDQLSPAPINFIRLRSVPAIAPFHTAAFCPAIYFISRITLPTSPSTLHNLSRRVQDLLLCPSAQLLTLC